MSNFEDQQELRKALSLHQGGRFDKAADLYRQIVRRNPKNYYALHYLGMIEAILGNYEEAKTFMDRSLSIQPPRAEFVENYATILFQMGDYKSALEISKCGLQLSPANVPLLYVSAISLFRLEQLEESVTQFDKLLLLAPNHIAAINERGSVLAEMKKYDAALASFDRALVLQPRYAEAHVNRGNIFGSLKRYDAALATYDRALALKPDLAFAWVGRGQVLGEVERHGEALAAYDRALALEPDLAQAWVGRGNILIATKRYDEAFAAYDRAVALGPELGYAPGARLFAKLCLCDWTNLEAETARLLSMIRQQKPASTPFHLLAVSSSAEDQQKCAMRQMQDRPRVAGIWRGEVYAHDRIRVAYLSGDFREHPVGYLTAGLFEHHDKARFETTAISFGADRDSPMRDRIKGAFENFIDVGRQSDHDIADLVRRLEIDIAVDLMGFTIHNRLGVLARRPAPIQVNYLGYSGTMGADCFDYILADATVIPEEQRAFYSEQVVWLPDCYLVNDDRRAIAERTPTRRECGLPEEGFVFCCFNNSYKLGPTTFAVWMWLLAAMPASVLWLSEANVTAQANLRRAAEQRGVAAERLIFAPRLPDVAEHLARQRQADLFLDTLPYNAHTTASDALWAGVPVLTCPGATFAGRVAASLVKAVGLDELIAPSLADYEARALALARDPARLAALRQKLARNRITAPLFDTERSTRNIEAAYATMVDIWRRGESPRSFSVEPM